MGDGFFVEICTEGCPPRMLSLPPGVLVVGRSPRSCRLVIADGRVSRVHVLVRRDANLGITIIDLYSANGTLLAGRPLPPGIAFHWLIDQMVTIGRTALILRYGLAGYPVVR